MYLASYDRYPLQISGQSDGDCYQPLVNNEAVEVCSRLEVNGRDAFTRVQAFGFGFSVVNTWRRASGVSPYARRQVVASFRTFQQLDISLDKERNEIGESSWKERYCSSECQSSVQQWDGLYPVSDDATGTIYANKLCAVCHDVKALTPWKIRAGCTKELLHYDFMGTFDKIAANVELLPICTITFIPPYQHFRYLMQNMFTDNNLRCVVDHRRIDCTKDTAFVMPPGQTFSEDGVVEKCNDLNGKIKHSDTKTLYFNQMCSICYNFTVTHVAFSFFEKPNNDGKVSVLLELNMDIKPDEFMQPAPDKTQRLACNSKDKVIQTFNN